MDPKTKNDRGVFPSALLIDAGKSNIEGYLCDVLNAHYLGIDKDGHVTYGVSTMAEHCMSQEEIDEHVKQLCQ
tara:strand:- start:445 stop:663 length:219 start_codon:yes stop_codon:yes gene_type:complete